MVRVERLTLEIRIDCSQCCKTRITYQASVHGANSGEITLQREVTHANVGGQARRDEGAHERGRRDQHLACTQPHDYHARSSIAGMCMKV